MSILNLLARSFDDANRMFTVKLIAAVVGVVAICGELMTSSKTYDWLQLVAFIGFLYGAACFTTISNRIWRQDAYIVVVCSAIMFAFDVAGVGNGRFPGLRLDWLWLALAVWSAGDLIGLIYEPLDTRKRRSADKPLMQRFGRMVAVAAIAFTIVAFLSYGGWMWLNVVIVDACLAVLLLAVHSTATGGRSPKAARA